MTETRQLELDLVGHQSHKSGAMALRLLGGKGLGETNGAPHADES